MGPIVVGSASLTCSQGSAPASLVVAEGGREAIDGQPVATVTDCAPLVNIPAFGLCWSPANPAVAEATRAAQGALTPRPCRPVPLGPWSPGSGCRRHDGSALLTLPSTCACAWSGVISVTDPGQEREVSP